MHSLLLNSTQNMAILCPTATWNEFYLKNTMNKNSAIFPIYLYHTLLCPPQGPSKHPNPFPPKNKRGDNSGEQQESMFKMLPPIKDQNNNAVYFVSRVNELTMRDHKRKSKLSNFRGWSFTWGEYYFTTCFFKSLLELRTWPSFRYDYLILKIKCQTFSLC